MARWQVGPKAAGQRADHFVASVAAGLSVARVRRLLADGVVRVDGRPARKGDRVAAGGVVEVPDDALAGVRGDPRVLPDPTLAAAVTILYSDDLLVAISKPGGVPSHPLRAGELGTAASAICARFPECAAASPDPREGGLVHRLDTETSGVLIAARSADAWARLRAALAAPTCEKTYLAEVRGAPPGIGVETAPIGRVGRRGGHVRVGAGRQPLPARTEWEVIARAEVATETTADPAAARALVRVRLHAGRAHQVRAHLAAAGFPIVGDARYGGARPDDERRGDGGDDVPGLRLHAASVQFTHPVSGQLILIEAPPPGWAMIRA